MSDKRDIMIARLKTVIEQLKTGRITDKTIEDRLLDVTILTHELVDGGKLPKRTVSNNFKAWLGIF